MCSRQNGIMASLGAVALLLLPACGTAVPQAGRPAGAGAAGPVVALDSGRICGADDDDVLRFRGIRYAKPPVGALRWRPPQPVAAWPGVVPATTSGPACPQASPNPKESSDAEDCLTLDVTVPRKAARGPRLVMVWLHGGGFNAGRGADYDPRRLAAEGGVVVVTVEFRLGVLGYLARSRVTSPACSTSWAWPTGPRPACSPTGPASSTTASGRRQASGRVSPWRLLGGNGGERWIIGVNRE
ncbi:carboxylesterase family protein [Nonomuraea sp. B12E4]|uniref:carboxylesterase family protein n=1 Tax=Nonomuraea sp. B12E4 TaxID=3153564 RepID=UPI00325ED68B